MNDGPAPNPLNLDGEKIADAIKGVIRVKLKKVGETFNIDTIPCEVVYVNEGRERMTSKVLEGDIPEIDKVFMSEGEEYIVNFINDKNKTFTIVPYKKEE